MVIPSISVNMINNLCRLQVPAKLLLHHQPMHCDIAAVL